MQRLADNQKHGRGVMYTVQAIVGVNEATSDENKVWAPAQPLAE
jgi:hypothetical protein